MQRTLTLAAGKLSAVRAELWTLHVTLESSAEEASEIEQGKRPESLAFAMQGAIECVNRDNLDGAIKTPGGSRPGERWRSPGGMASWVTA